MKIATTLQLLCGASALAAASCQSARPTEGDPASPLGFVLERYDRDRDGRVSLEEYGRSHGEFARLDVNGDGELGPSDFRLSGRRMLGLSPTMARRERARHLLAWYFQDDVNPHVLTEGELLRSWEVYDADGNGWVGRREFDAAAPLRAASGRRPAGALAGLIENETTDPWERILEGVDQTDDGFVDVDEIMAFYGAKYDSVPWQFDPATGVAGSLSLEGTVAPDFTLPSIDSDGESITLSDFAGDVPVALIFGSYT